jgi:hypothetical protein
MMDMSEWTDWSDKIGLSATGAGQDGFANFTQGEHVYHPNIIISSPFLYLA